MQDGGCAALVHAGGDTGAERHTDKPHPFRGSLATREAGDVLEIRAVPRIKVGRHLATHFV